jgi:dUTPase
MTNIRTIITIIDNQFRNMVENTATNFNMMQINFQTMDRNDQLIFASVESLSNKINSNNYQLTIYQAI